MFPSGYPVLLFPSPTDETTKKADSYGVCTTAMRGLADLKSIMFLQHKLPLNARVQYSLLITFKRPILEQTAFTLAAIQKPDHQLHKILAPFPQSIMKSPDFWVEMHMTAPSGNRIANLVMPAGMGEAGAAKANGRDFTSLILGQSLTSLYQTSLDALGDPEMRCAVPLAEVRVRDIVQYRNVKLALKDGLEDIAVRGDSVQTPDRNEYIHEPILAFCGICFKLSTKHKRCGGCKIAHYCSSECQKKDWLKTHKLECKAIQSEQKEWVALL